LQTNGIQPNRKLIWIFCFEYAGIAKVGGLGEVSTNQTENLIDEPELDLHVFMPGHGKHLELRDKLHLAPLQDKEGRTLLLKGNFDPAYYGINAGDQMHMASFSKFQSVTNSGYFEVEVWKGQLNKVPIYLLVGANPIASFILNDPDVYSANTLNAKLGLFSLAMKEFMKYCLANYQEFIPSLIHIHDHHPVGALLCCRQELNLVGRDIRSIITMHLLTWPRREIEFYWKSGVNNEPMLVQIGTYRIWRRFTEIFDMCKESITEPPTIEQIGCAIADRVIAVSETFMKSDIIPFCGKDIIRWKSDFTWNGCDWDYEVNLQKVVNQFQNDLGKKDIQTIRSWDLRNLLVTKTLGHLPPGEPKFSNDNIRKVVSNEFSIKPYNNDCTVDPFQTDGPLVLITGRVSPQKGVENLFGAIPYVIEQIPNVRFVFLMVPTPYNLDDLRNYMAFARKYPENIRFVFGVAGSIYLLGYLAADIYCCPSRWEPFGIVALEGMASKVPVVATYVGGLQESILHLEDNPDAGTGLLCPNNDIDALKYALVSLLSAIHLAELKSKTPNISQAEINSWLNKIVHPNLKKKVAINPLFGLQIRENAYQRIVSTFRWKTVSQKLKQLYLSLNY
jgi:glycogen synthase